MKKNPASISLYTTGINKYSSEFREKITRVFSSIELRLQGLLFLVLLFYDVFLITINVYFCAHRTRSKAN